MQDLTPVGLDKDGRKLILISSSGEEFAVSVDARLRAAMRGDESRFAQLEMKMESALRPRDIQARIRGGESPEQVAAAAKTTVEAIMPFAQPVLDERAHVAQGARNASVRRRGAGSSTAVGSLAESAEVYFLTNGLHDEDVTWDAWRRPDNVWVLVANYAIGGNDRRAEFTHDLRGRYVVAENDEARLLTGELQSAPPQPPTGSGGSARRPLSAVPPPEELPLGDDALALVDERDASSAQETPIAAPESSAGSAWSRPEAGLDTESLLSDDDIDPAAPVDDLPAPQSVQADTEPTQELDQLPPDSPDDAATQAVLDPPGEALTSDAPPQSRKPKKRSGRASVPSWDEIMFGGGKKD